MYRWVLLSVSFGDATPTSPCNAVSTRVHCGDKCSMWSLTEPWGINIKVQAA